MTCRHAERALRCIATRMRQDGTRDLQWWRVPAWTHAAARVIATWLGGGFAGGLAAGLGAMIVYSNTFGLAQTLIFGFVYGLVCAIVAGLALGRGNKIP